MDILDPLDDRTNCAVGTEDVGDVKVILNEGLNITEEQGMDSDEEQRVSDHLSPQTLLEAQGEEVQYSYRSPEGTVTYGVLKVEDGIDHVPHIVTTNTNFTNSNVQQMLTSNLNAQLYVIGNPNDVFISQGGNRAIAPRSTIVDGTPTVTTNIKKRDERRRATHNEVERRRRDKINNWITKLSKIIPDGAAAEMKGNGHYDGQSKGGILAKACEYIVELRDSQKALEAQVRDQKQLLQNYETLKQTNMTLTRQNSELCEILKRHSIEVPRELSNDHL